MQNKLDELWSLLNFLMPTLFDSAESFQLWFGQGQPQGDSMDSLLREEEVLLVTSRLHQVLRPFMLRRLKESVVTELPAKVNFSCYRVITSISMALSQFLWYKAVQQLRFLTCRLSKLCCARRPPISSFCVGSSGGTWPRPALGSRV